MCTTQTACPQDRRLQRTREVTRDLDPLPRFVEELRQYTSRHSLVAPSQVQRQMPLMPPEQHVRLDVRAHCSRLLTQGGPGDQDLVGIPNSDHLHADQARGGENRV